ncbi:hypothetical protein TNCV_3405691 [Trichonephila clavipes]|nr:hypothetical protein TNCV_3405691 [Trichonephila clavipes]
MLYFVSKNRKSVSGKLPSKPDILNTCCVIGTKIEILVHSGAPYKNMKSNSFFENSGNFWRDIIGLGSLPRNRCSCVPIETLRPKICFRVQFEVPY